MKKKARTKGMALVLALMMLITSLVWIPSDEVKAASSNVYINPYSATVVTYKTGDGVSKNWSVISIMGCSKKSEIKNLKCSNKNMSVEKQNGYLVVYFGDKAQKATITCTVKGVKLKTTLTVKKYSNPASSIKFGKKNLTSQFKNNTVYHKRGTNFNNQNLQVNLKNGWKITSIYISNGNKRQNIQVNAAKFSKKITLKGKNSYCYIYCKNDKTKVSEVLSITY